MRRQAAFCEIRQICIIFTSDVRSSEGMLGSNTLGATKLSHTALLVCYEEKSTVSISYRRDDVMTDVLNALREIIDERQSELENLRQRVDGFTPDELQIVADFYEKGVAALAGDERRAARWLLSLIRALDLKGPIEAILRSDDWQLAALQSLGGIKHDADS